MFQSELSILLTFDSGERPENDRIAERGQSRGVQEKKLKTRRFACPALSPESSCEIQVFIPEIGSFSQAQFAQSYLQAAQKLWVIVGASEEGRIQAD